MPSLEAFIAPLAVNSSERPAAYVWAVTQTEKRQSVPRGTPPNAGWKEANYLVEVYLTYNDQADAADADFAFPSVIDVVMQTFRSSTDPVQVTDALTGAESWLVDIGERLEFQYIPVHSLADQRMIRYDARVGVTVTEEFQA